MSVSNIISQIPEEEKNPTVLILVEIIRSQAEEIQQLKDEIARLKGSNKKPKISPSKLEDKDRKKTKELSIHDKQVIAPGNLPKGITFKGYQDFVVQDIKFEPFNTLYRLERWEGLDGEYLIGKLLEEISGHFGNTLVCFVLYQYYHAHVTQPLIHEQLC